MQVMSRAYTKEEYTYLGRYSFRWRAAEEVRLPPEEWDELPQEVCLQDLVPSARTHSLMPRFQMKRHILRHIVYARDEHAKKLTAHAYLRAGKTVVDPSAVRELVQRDKCRNDRFARSSECIGMREVREALDAGTEVSCIYFHCPECARC